MTLKLAMVGLIVRDMPRALAFYRRLGLEIPAAADGQTHVQVPMGDGFTFFLDCQPTRWDPLAADDPPAPAAPPAAAYQSLLEFMLPDGPAVDERYQALVAAGDQSHRPPYDTAFGMRFAFVKDPDGNTVLLSGPLAPAGEPPAAG